MAKYRTNLPQLNGGKFITDGGLETTLVFHEGHNLPEFAAFNLLKSDGGYGIFEKYYSTYAAIAIDHNIGLILESFTWRASSIWGEKLGYSKKALARFVPAIGVLASPVWRRYVRKSITESLVEFITDIETSHATA